MTSSGKSSDEGGIDLVIKVGGAEGVTFGGLASDVGELVGDGLEIVVVHGGSAEATSLGNRLGLAPEFITSPSGNVSRRTDRSTIEALQANSVNALGLTGLDGGLLVGSRKKTVKSVKDGRVVVLRDDFGGKVERVNVSLLRTLVGAGYLPVIGPLALSHEGQTLNVDADRVSAMVAIALRAKTLVILSNVPGLLRDPSDHSSLIGRIPAESVEDYERFAVGRMKKKLLAASEALAGGVGRVIISDARRERPVIRALRGDGTVIE